jgi:hypothetical protein
MKKSETLVQFSCETSWEYLRNEWRRSQGKRLSYLKNRYQWRQYPSKQIVAPFPLNLDIEVSSKCQIQCDHCFRQYMDVGENDLMPWEMYRQIVDECGRYGLFTLKFSMRGEPLLHPDIVEMVAYAKRAGVKEVWINTNGGMLNEHMARGLLTAGTDWITMSFDGLGAMYESIRKPLKYEESLYKLKCLRRLRDEIKAPTLLNVQSLWSAIGRNPHEYVELMKSIVDRVAYNPDMDFGSYTMVPDHNFICPRLWQRICITSKGKYLKCPSDFMMQEVLGDISDYSVKQAWDMLQGEHRKMHLDLRKKESTVCNKCHHGAKKISKKVTMDGADRNDFTYVRNQEFQGHGLNRKFCAGSGNWGVNVPQIR